MPTLVGIDGYPGGWVAATIHEAGIGWTVAIIDEIDALCPTDAVVAIDIPIGLLDTGWRDCDRLAKVALPGASSRVFMTPPRAVLEVGLGAPNDQAQDVSRRLTGQGVSRQALGLATRILAVDRMLARAARPGVIEVHPELCFAAMAGDAAVALVSKKSAAGVGQRLAELRPWLPDVDAVIAACPPGVPIDDALDALAALWSAQRWTGGQARTLPEGTLRRPFIAV